MELLSPDFSLEELVYSPTAHRLGLDNTPDDDIIESMRTLCIHLWQPIRDEKGPIIVDSGYRSYEVNKAVGGTTNSQHMRGQAIDGRSHTVSTYDLAKWITENVEFDEVILECYTPGAPWSGWVHASYHQGQNRKNVLTAFRKDGKFEYERGLIK